MTIYCKIRQKFTTKCVRFFITKSGTFITKCESYTSCDKSNRKCDRYYKMRSLVQIETVHSACHGGPTHSARVRMNSK